jgi:glycosyltransferase involved in cell wall biosynthesis
VITHGETGFLHDPNDLDGMASSALAILTDSALRNRLSQAARATIVERYCEQRIVPMYEEFYARLNGQAAGGRGARSASL